MTGILSTGWDAAFDNITHNTTVTAQYSFLVYTVTYSSGEGGVIDGEAFQTVKHGEDSTKVTALPDAGYHFVQWSDGSAANPRIDVNVNEDITVSAIFEYIPGDVNLNGVIDMGDAILLARYASGLTELTDLQKKIGNLYDHEDDNDVGMVDAVKILAIMVDSGL